MEIHWNARYQELVDFYRANGHCKVPKQFKENPSLRLWVQTQRQDYRKKCEGHVSPMTDDRVELLKKIEFVWNVHDSTWMSRYDELIEFQQSHGHCNVPQNYCANKRLGEWVMTQRRHYRHQQEGKQSRSMTNERISMLEAIGFVWDAQESGWITRYEELIQFKQGHGHCNVPRDFSANKQLGEWVHTQRKQYRLRQEGKQSSTMTNERVRMLEEIGFVWKANGAVIGFVWNPLGNAWMEQYEELKQFKQSHEHCNVPQDYANKELGEWVHSQRKQYRLLQEGHQSSPMTNDRITLMEKIGYVFWWMLGYTPPRLLKNERLKMLYDIGLFDDDPELLKWVRKYLAKNNYDTNKKDDGEY